MKMASVVTVTSKCASAEATECATDATKQKSGQNEGCIRIAP